MQQKLTYVNCVEEGSMASIRDNHPLCIFFPARFLLLLAQSFTEHGRYALGVIVGDEGMYRRYEADFSYGLLGTWDNPTSSSVSVGADSIHGIWRWTLAGAASGVVGAAALFWFSCMHTSGYGAEIISLVT